MKSIILSTLLACLIVTSIALAKATPFAPPTTIEIHGVKYTVAQSFCHAKNCKKGKEPPLCFPTNYETAQINKDDCLQYVKGYCGGEGISMGSCEWISSPTENCFNSGTSTRCNISSDVLARLTKMLPSGTTTLSVIDKDDGQGFPGLGPARDISPFPD